MYFSEQFSPIAENIMTGGKEKLKLVLRMYTIQVPITETIQRGGSRFRSAPMSRHCGTPFDVVTYLGYYVIFIKITHHRAESIITLSFHKRIRVLQW